MSRIAPMFPLGTVLFPHAVLPLHVFEPRYRALTRAVLDGDQEFGVVLIERGSEVGGGDVRFGVGTVAHIVQASELADGRFALAVVGVSRFRVEQWLPDEPYPRAEIVAFDDDDVDDDVDATPAAAAAALVDPVVAALREVYELYGRVHGVATPAPPEFSPDPEQASYEVAAAASLGPLDAQGVLETADTGARLRVLRELLADHAALLRGQLGA
jgi:Lon protease-like protein